ncbi:MAG: cytochrome c oxidase subunit I [Ilumatobacteraceae bacterium]
MSEVDIDTLVSPPARNPLPRTFLGWLTTTDHKAIGVMYAVASFGFLLVGGALAGMMRAELARPGEQFVGAATYNQLFTIHGSAMVYLFAVPFGVAIANYLVPLQIGAPDMAFPRLNALSFWMYLFGGLIMLSGFITTDGAADFGWTAYAPLAGRAGSPGAGADLWIIALLLTGTAGTMSAVNTIATIVMLRAPGMTMFRLPILTWNLLLTAFMVLLAFPVLSAALLMLLASRQLDAPIFDVAGGGAPILWQHLFWFFGHPEVYIVALPFFGVVTEIIPVFSRRPVFGYKGLVIATISISSLSTSVWAHHMFVTGDVVVEFFAITSMLIAIPTGVKVFNWIGTMVGGSLIFPPPMLFTLGFLVTFVFGGITGVMLASPALDFQASDSYFVVGHFHYVMGGTVVFSMFAAVWFWWPKVTGRMLEDRLGRIQFWLLLVGYNATFIGMHLLGNRGLPRRIADYPANAGFDDPNLLSSLGFVVMAISFVPFAWAIVRSLRSGASAGADPWHGNSLEWATSSPPPVHNFDWLPPIRSERPVFDLRWIEHPDIGSVGEADAWLGRQAHDERWFPLHPWREDGAGAEPTGSGATKVGHRGGPAGEDEP